MTIISGCGDLIINISSAEYTYGNLSGVYSGYGYSWGYGYGYGSTYTSSGSVTYTLLIKTPLLPSNFIGKEIEIEAVITDSNQQISDTSSISITQSKVIDDESLVNEAYTALTNKRVLNGNAALDKITSNLYLPSRLKGLEGVRISWQSDSAGIISTNGTVARDSLEDKYVKVTADITKGTVSKSKTFDFVVKKKVPPAVVNNATGKIDVVNPDEDIVIDQSNVLNLREIEINDNGDKPVVLNLMSLVTPDKKLNLSTSSLTLTRNTGSVTYSVEIPLGTIIQGNDDWNGLITLPTIKGNDGKNITNGNAELVIEVGSENVKLTFDKAVKITLPGQTGKKAGYIFNEAFTEITECTSSDLSDPDTLVAEGDCFTNLGADMIIWTKHFTEFVSYTPTSSGTSNSNTVSAGISSGKSRPSPGSAVAVPEAVPEEAVEEQIPAQVESIVEEIPQEKQGFFDALTGAVIGGIGKLKDLAPVGVAIIAIAGFIGLYYRNKKIQEQKRREEIDRLIKK